MTLPLRHLERQLESLQTGESLDVLLAGDEGVVVDTPAMFRSQVPPWPQETPSPTPMSMNVQPSFAFTETEAGDEHLSSALSLVAALVTNELLRTVCAPLFEQMLTAMHGALHDQLAKFVQQSLLSDLARTASDRSWKEDAQIVSGQLAQQPLQAEIPRTAPSSSSCSREAPAVAASERRRSSDGSASTLMPPTRSTCPLGSPLQRWSLLYGKDADTSDSPAAFSGTLSLPVRTTSSSDAPSRNRSAEQLADLEPEANIEEKKHANVCHHWKAKGYCKMEDKCRFRHPEDKKGVGAATAQKGSVQLSSQEVNHAGNEAPKSARSGTTSAQSSPPAEGVKKRHRAGRNHHHHRDHDDQDVEHGVVSVSSISSAQLGPFVAMVSPAQFGQHLALAAIMPSQNCLGRSVSG